MKVVVAFIVGVLVGSSAFPDEWLPPTPRTYTSSRGQYRLTVFPRGLTGALPYFRDKVEGRSSAGQREEGLPSCEATLERLADSRYELLWRKSLINDVTPVQALVSDHDGSFVTFDNWHSMGWGDDVIVVYGRTGELVRSFALRDIMTEQQVRKLPRSVSSIWWSGQHRISDDERGVEVLVVVNSEMDESKRKYRTVHIRLSDGAVTK